MKRSLFVLLACITFMVGCTPCPPVPETVCGMPTIKPSLESMIPESNRSYYQMQLTETEDTIVGSYSLKPGLADNLFSPANLKEGVVTGCYSLRARKDSSASLFRSILVETDTAFVLSLKKEFGTIVGSQSFRKVKPSEEKLDDPGIPWEPNVPWNPCDDPGCHQYFADSIYPGLLKLANKWCQPVRYCYGCPRWAPCVFYMVAVYPTSWRCRIRHSILWNAVELSMPSRVPVEAQ